jgi:cell filamentation protein, protein adenylyltransferase
MELQVLDPWGDYETAGYLGNHYQEKDLSVVGRLETAAFEQEVPQTLRVLMRLPTLSYQHITETHRTPFSSVYPWAGQDRSETAPNIAIAKNGYNWHMLTPSLKEMAEPS